jgi:hypothetical protein
MPEIKVTPSSIHTFRNSDGYYFSQASPGTVIRFATGEYRFVHPHRFVTTPIGTEKAPIKFVSESQHSATILALGGPRGETFAWENYGAYVEVAGFEITSDGGCRIGVLNRGRYAKVIGNKVHGIVSTNPAGGGAGIDHVGEYSDTIGNLVFDIRSEIRNPDGSVNDGVVHGIYHAVRGGRIWNNICCGCSGGYGIHLWHVPRDITIANNLVIGCSKSGIIVGAGDQHTPDPIPCDNCLVVNNIIVGASEFGLRSFGVLGPNNRYIHNITYQCQLGSSSIDRGTETNTSSVDPFLVSLSPDGSGNYRLKPGSPCIDAGDAEGAPTFDYLETPRPKGRGWDIGPFEFAPDPLPASGMDSMEYLLPIKMMG